MGKLFQYHETQHRLAVALASLIVSSAAQAAQPVAKGVEGYPSRPLRIVVGIPPGGGVDTVARAVAQKLTERWDRTVVVENRTGAGGGIAMEVAAQANPDGHTILAGSVVTVATATLLKKVPFDTRQVYAPIIQTQTQPYVLAIENGLPVSSVKELIAYAKNRPGLLNYASTGTASGSHLGMEFFKLMAGVDLVHVPYRGLGPAMIDLIAGQIQTLMGAAIIVMPNVRTGKLRALAVGSAKRAAAYPEIPTVAESGLPGYEWSNSYAFFAPLATPAPIVALLNREIGEIVHLPDVQKKLAADGVEALPPNSPEQFKAKFAEEYDKLDRFFKTSKLRL